MNASVAFYSPEKPGAAQAESKPVVTVPASAVRDGAVFVVLDGKAVRSDRQSTGTTSQGVEVIEGLIGGEDLIVNPPAEFEGWAESAAQTGLTHG